MNPILPLTILFAGFPFFGRGASTKAWVKKTLSNVDGAVFLVKLFIAIVAVALGVILCFWLISLHRKKNRQKMLLNIVALLQRLRADISLLHNESDMEPILKQELEMSKKQAISLLKRYFMKKKLLRKRSTRGIIPLGAYGSEHFAKSLEIIANDRVSRQNQVFLIDQWIKNLQK
jgi:hypothetical protein